VHPNTRSRGKEENIPEDRDPHLTRWGQPASPRPAGLAPRCFLKIQIRTQSFRSPFPKSERIVEGSVLLNRKVVASSSSRNSSPSSTSNLLSFSRSLTMAAQSTPMTPKLVTMANASPSAPSKSNQSCASSSSVHIIESFAMAEAFPLLPSSKRGGPQAGRPGRCQPASPPRRSPLSHGRSPTRSPGVGANVHTRAKTPTRPTMGVLSPRKMTGKRLVTFSSGGRVAQVPALQVVELKSSKYTLASPSLPRHRMCG
jgi:hypothetical protein